MQLNRTRIHFFQNKYHFKSQVVAILAKRYYYLIQNIIKRWLIDEANCDVNEMDKYIYCKQKHYSSTHGSC